GPNAVGLDVVAEPGVAHRDGAIMHVILLVRHDDGDGRHRAESDIGAGEGGEGLVERGVEVIAGRGVAGLPIHGWVMLALILVLAGNRGGAVAREADRGQAFGVGREGQAFGQQQRAEIWRGERRTWERGVIVASLVRAGEKVEVVWLA